ncbi:beta-lactamase domain-containing protein [Favolaschia claudopus]|uniref:Beta-lactamase domain-containing protein n=1 Tax=Favolaschia claudopus TaxID=2862362 RepID=A0AAW0EEK5_9AGAR
MLGITLESRVTIEEPFPSISFFAMILFNSLPVFAFATVVLAQQTGSENGTYIDGQLTSAIQSIMNKNNITGLALGILSPTGNVEFGAWGNRTETGDKVQPDTIFGIGSLSKGFLSASLGILMQDFADGVNKTALPEGVPRFDWDTKVTDLLPGEWKTEDEFSTVKADLRDLLSHVTGLPAHDMSYSANDSPHDLVVRMRNLRTAYEFRQLFEYNNQMFITGAYIVSKLSGISYSDFVENRIMLPLNMSSSTLHPDNVLNLDTFSQTWSPSGRRIPFFADEQGMEFIAGAGGVISTAQDMLKWAKLILNGGVVAETNSTIIPHATFQLATTGNSVLAAANKGDGRFAPMQYGLGWVRTAYRGHELIWHNGGAPGVSSMCTIFPYDNFAVVVLSNTAGSGPNDIAIAVADRVLGLAASPASESSSGLLGSTSTSNPSATPTATSSVVPSNAANLAGEYANAGYGNFTLCSASSSTPACIEILKNFTKVDTAAGKSTSLNSTELYGVWPRFWGTHLRFIPIPGTDYYAGELTTLYVDGYGADKTPFEDPVFTFVLSFMEEEGKVVGLGFFVAQATTWREKKGGNVREMADAWFDKI